MRGPVGSLVHPELSGEFEAFDGSCGVTVHVHKALLERAGSETIEFQFGLLGRCTAVLV